jgi:hypothetical protein
MWHSYVLKYLMGSWPLQRHYYNNINNFKADIKVKTIIRIYIQQVKCKSVLNSDTECMLKYM